MQGNLVIISSPSGGGKGTLIREVLRTVPDVGYSVSLTTRDARPGEVDGIDYHFVVDKTILFAPKNTIAKSSGKICRCSRITLRNIIGQNEYRVFVLDITV